MASYLASCCIRPGIPWSSHDVLSVDGIVAGGVKCHHVNGGLTESLGKEASADEPAYRLAGNVSVEFDVALVEEQVRACGLRSGYAREPLVVSLVLREEAILSEGGRRLPS